MTRGDLAGEFRKRKLAWPARPLAGLAGQLFSTGYNATKLSSLVYTVSPLCGTSRAGFVHTCVGSDVTSHGVPGPQ